MLDDSDAEVRKHDLDNHHHNSEYDRTQNPPTREHEPLLRFPGRGPFHGVGHQKQQHRIDHHNRYPRDYGLAGRQTVIIEPELHFSRLAIHPRVTQQQGKGRQAQGAHEDQQRQSEARSR